MASVRTANGKTSGAAVPPPPPPMKEVRTTTTEIRQEPTGQLVIPAKPSLKEYMAALKPDEWKDYKYYLRRRDKDIKTEGYGYVARLFPPGSGIVTDRDKGWYLMDNFDFNDFPAALEAWTMEELGGGYYMLQLNRSDGKTIYSPEYPIPGPAKLTPRESYKDGATPYGGGNDEFKQIMISLLKEKQNGQGVGSQEKLNLQTILDVVQKANDQALNLAKSQIAPQAGPGELLTSLLTVMDKLGLTGKREDESAAFDKHVATLERLGMLNKPNGAAAAAPVDPLEYAAKTVNQMKSLGLAGSIAGVATGEDWRLELAKAAPAILPHVKSIVHDLTSGVVAFFQSRTPAAAPALPPNVALVTQPVRTQMKPQFTPRRPSAPAQAGNGAAEAAAPATAPAEPQITQEIFQAVWGQAVKARAVELFMEGENADDIAFWLRMTNKPMATILGSMSSSDLEEQLKQDPIMKEMVTHARWPKFVEEFLEAFQVEPEPQAG